ncbi:MAG: TIGR02266 family protein [Deltaproteobacteria bacterium]|nr:TIGR02266 family protein [Deltaproteobacteria bacterium]
MATARATQEMPLADDPESQVLEAEERITQGEFDLIAEVSRMVSAAVALQKRIGSVKGRALNLDAASPEAASLKARVAQLALPVLKIAPHRRRALQARLEAVRVRQEALDTMREARQDCAMALADLSQGLGNAEAALVTVERAPRPRAPAPAFQGPPPAARPKPVPAPAAMVTPLAAERRKADRVRLEAKVDFESEHNFYTGLTVDISEGGLFISTIDILPRGTPIDLQLNLAGHSIAAKGEVRWIRDYNDLTPKIEPGMGIQFTDLAPAAHNLIHQFAARRDPLLYDE